MESHTHWEIAQHMGRSVKNVAKTITLRPYASKANSDKHDSSHSRPKKGKGKGKKFHEVTENNNEMDDLADQVQSLFYHDVHFNSVNTRMHTKLECEMPHRLKTSETFKIDTGADGNLMPITMFAKLVPKNKP